jgi:hypothetical protein
MTPAERIAIAQARAKAQAELERHERAEALARKQAKLRAITARDSRIPARMVRP